MPRNFRSQGPGGRGQGPGAGGQSRDLTRRIRIILGALLALNLIAAGFVLFPPGGSADDLERELASLQSQLAQKRALLDRTRLNVAAIEKARGEGDRFLGDYFLTRRSVDSALLTELSAAAAKAQIKERDSAQTTEPIEGSDSLGMMTITANFEGTYRNLLNFINELDRSKQLLIIESLTAAPQQGANILSVSMKIDAFVREESQVESGASSRETAQAASREGSAR